MERRVRDQHNDLGGAAPPAQLGAAQQNLARGMAVIVGFLEEGSLRVFLHKDVEFSIYIKISLLQQLPASIRRNLPQESHCSHQDQCLQFL